MVDNLLRPGPLNVTFLLHTPTAQYGSAKRQGNDSTYAINVTVSDMGTFVLEVFLSGMQVEPEMALVSCSPTERSLMTAVLCSCRARRTWSMWCIAHATVGSPRNDIHWLYLFTATVCIYKVLQRLGEILRDSREPILSNPYTQCTAASDLARTYPVNNYLGVACM